MKLSLKFKILLVGLVLSGVLVTFFSLKRQKTTTLDLTECFTSNNEVREIILPDKTTVYLNSGSVLLYPKEFTSRSREVFLSGEACFIIKSEKNQRPFLVNTEKLDVSSSATSFLITAYPNNEEVMTTLVDGNLNLFFQNSNKAVSQHEINSRIDYDTIGNRTRKTNIESRKVFLFKEGYLVFQSVSFDYMMKTMERHFNRIFNYDAGKYAGRYFSVTFFPNVDVMEALSVLNTMIADFTYSIKDDIIYIN